MATVNANVRWSDNTADLKARLMEGIGVIDAMKASVDRTANAIGGQGLFLQANKLTAAIEQLGGITKLTASEQERANATLDKAIEKYKVMGMTAPPAMVEMRDRLKDLVDASNQAKTGSDQLGQSWVARIAEGMLLRDAIRFALQELKSMAEFLPELAMRGAVVGEIEESFQHLTAQAGLLGDKLLGTLRAGTHGTVDDFTLMQRVNKDLAAGLNLTDEQFGTLTKGAFALSKATGTDVTEALNSMSDAMVTGRAKAVAMLTGKIDLKAAEEEFAKSLGTTADHLTAEGKLEADRTAILAHVQEALGRVGEMEDGLEDRVNQGKVAWANYTDELGKAIAQSPVLNAGLAALQQGLTNAFGGERQASIRLIAGLVNELAIDIVDIGIVATQAATVSVTVWDVMKVVVLSVEKAFVDLVSSIATSYSWIAQLATKIPGATDATRALAASAKESADSWKLTSVAMGEEIADAAAGVVGHSKLNQEIDAGAGVLMNMRDSMIKANAATADGTKSLKDQAAAHDAAGAAAGRQGLVVAQTAAEIKAALKAQEDDQIKFDQSITESRQRAIDLWRAIEKTGNEQGLKEYEKYFADVHKAADQFGKEIIAGDAAITKARRENLDLVDQHAMSSYDFQRKQASQSVADQVAAFKGTPEQFARFYLEISATAREKYRDIASAEQEALSAMRAQELTWSNGFTKILSGIPQLVQQAFTGGGGMAGIGKALLSGFGALAGQQLISGPLTSLFNAAAPAISGALGMTLTTAIGSAIPFIGPAIGALAGPLISGLKKLFGGPSAAELAGRDLEKQFETSMGGWQGIQTALLGTGMAADQVNAKIQALWAAEKQGADATKAQIESINGLLNDQKQDQNDLNAALGRYKFTTEELGPAMQKQQLHDQALQLVTDWTALIKSGIDVSLVNQKMASDMNDYLAIARKTGQEVPIEMQPMIQKMIDQGVLLDANGQKITDMSGAGVTFAETMTQGFERVTAKLQELIDKIGGQLPAALQKVPSSVDVAVNLNGHWNVPDLPTQAADGSYAAAGGFVTNHGIQYLGGGGNVLPFPSRGTDTVAAMLTPGESVLTRSATAALGVNTIRALNRGERLGGGASASGPMPRTTASADAAGQPTVYQYIEVKAMDARGVEDVLRKHGRALAVIHLEQLARGGDILTKQKQALGLTTTSWTSAA